MKTESTPTAERILSTLISLYCDQMGVEVDYEMRSEVNDDAPNG